VKDIMQFVPWQYVADWKCISCGDCCRLYSVVIDFKEWLGIIKNYGVEQTASGLNKLFINRKNDGSCAFLNNGAKTCLCGLQHMKPKACQLWPFKVLSKPQYGYPAEALYLYRGEPLFVYADSMCRGLRLGRPIYEFVNYTVQEFVEIAAGIRSNQFRTTSGIGFSQPFSGFRTIRGTGRLRGL
jgi:Fe-S-cluster containining protein